MATNDARGEVVVTWPMYDPDGSTTGRILRDLGYAVRLEPKTGARSVEELVVAVGDAVAVIASTDPFDATVFEACPGLRVIARTGVGTDAIDLAAATAHNVVVTTTPGANEETVADHTLALLLSVIRRISEHDQSMRAGRWDRAGTLTPSDVFESTVGLVGSGTIGRAVIARLRGFGCTILVTDPALEQPLPGTELVDLDELLLRSDSVSLHVPLLDSTENLIGERELSLMKPSAVLVNASRGRIVDEVALHAALVAGEIAGAGFDVFAQEPPVNSSLLELPNVVLTPHVGGLSHRAIAAMTERATKSVSEVLRGLLPDDAVNPEAMGIFPRPETPQGQ